MAKSRCEDICQDPRFVMKKTNIVLIFNGLGNQMSQYAFYLAMHDRLPNTKYICWDNDHNGYELGRLFGIRKHKSPMELFILRVLLAKKNIFILSILKLLFNKLGYGAIHEESNYTYDVNWPSSPFKRTYWYGGWHNFRYFSNIKSKILNTFQFPSELLNKYSHSILEQIISTESVAIHIRRGDYLSEDNIGLFGNICTDRYYTAAIRYIEDHVSDPRFFIFSNDSSWVEDNLKIRSAVYVNMNHGGDSWMDMFLMGRCKNLIIANSTFSWWSAYLSSANIIICPTQFNNHPESGEIYPDEWVRIGS